MEDNLVGKLIIAPPAVKGNFWYKTVTLITEHLSDGSTGLVLNKRSQMSLVQFGEEIGFDLDLPGFVYVGGPVNVKNLTLLHSSEWSSTNTLYVTDELSISSDTELLERLSAGDTPEFYRVFLGMAGWSSGQLEAEIEGVHPWNKTNSWCVATGSNDLIFGSDQVDQWVAALDVSGQQFAQKLLA